MDQTKPSKSSMEDTPVFSADDLIKAAGRRLKPVPGLPSFCVLGFFPSIGTYLKHNQATRIIPSFQAGHPYYIFDYEGKTLAYQQGAIGAPAAGLLLEEGIALGMEQCVVLGTAGVLDESIAAGEVLLVESAVSDEGTSRHYMPRSEDATADAGLLGLIRSTLDSRGVPYRRVKTWTMDAPFRETPRKIRRAIEAGCSAVDMEAAALYTISECRHKKIAGIFIATDAVTEAKWTPRKIPKTVDVPVPIRLFQIIAEMGAGI
jgi:uridine phosphorylase